MWNPETYLDTDYGLDEDESFEPTDAWEPEPFDTSQPHVMTVLGAVSPDDLGITQIHEHILSDPPALRDTDPDYCLVRPDLARDELEFFATAGGSAMVDASTPDYGRDIAGLHTLAQLVPVHLIAVGGRHKHLHASLVPGAGDEEFLVEELRADLSEVIRPGLLKFGTSLNDITAVEWANARAVARVAVEYGYPVTTHTEVGTMALEQVDLAGAAGLDPQRIIIGHLDRRLEWPYLAAVARTGAWLSFDQVGKARFGPDGPKAEMLVRLAHAGFADQLLVSQDLARTTDFITRGGSPGWTHLIERFTIELMEAGAEAMLVRRLLIDNPARALTVHPPA
jgi:phosphotriesterase-related protein